MNEDDEGFWPALKAYKKEKFDTDRAKFLADAIASDTSRWTKNTEYHWSCQINGSRLDYWPSRKKYQYKGKIMRGNVQRFIEKLELSK